MSSGGKHRTRPPSLPLLSPRFSGRLWGFLLGGLERGEVAGEGRVGLDSDDLAVLLPYVLEEVADQLAASVSTSQKLAKSSSSLRARSMFGLAGGFARCSCSSIACAAA